MTLIKQRQKHIRKGDRVLVLAGNQKGKCGEILAVKGDRVVIQGLNMRKKHIKKSQQHPNGQILTLEQPIHVSNVVVCDKDDRPLKLKVHVTPEGERQLVYRQDDEQRIYRILKKKQP